MGKNETPSYAGGAAHPSVEVSGGIPSVTSLAHTDPNHPVTQSAYWLIFEYFCGNGQHIFVAQTGTLSRAQVAPPRTARRGAAIFRARLLKCLISHYFWAHNYIPGSYGFSLTKFVVGEPSQPHDD